MKKKTTKAALAQKRADDIVAAFKALSEHEQPAWLDVWLQALRQILTRKPSLPDLQATRFWMN